MRCSDRSDLSVGCGVPVECDGSRGWNDKYPTSPGHLLLIPFRHVAGLFDAELTALLALVREAKTFLDGRFHPDGFNVGVNVRAAAGRTVMHVIPRYAGDVKDPRGGVRGVIPERQGY